MTRGKLQLAPMTRAFTLVEVAVALALSGLVGVASLMMLSSLGSVTNAKYNTRVALVKDQVATLRLGSLLRSATMVLAASSDRIVLWTHDANSDGAPNLSELRLLRYDATSREVRVHEAISPVPDTAYALSSDFIAITSALMGTPVFPGTTVLTDVSSWSITLDNATPRLSHLARMTITVECPSGAISTTLTATPKCVRAR